MRTRANTSAYTMHASGRLACRRWVALLVALHFFATIAAAQEFGCRWMACAEPDDTSCVWFRRTIVSPTGGAPARRPHEALLHVATTGKLIIYVNNRIVSPALYMPERASGDTSVVGFTLDVRRFMRPDTNTIAIAYCPSIRTRRQLSATLYGKRADGSRFAVSGVDGWLCRRADRWLTADGGEAADPASYPYPWTSPTQPLALWLAAEGYESKGYDGKSDESKGYESKEEENRTFVGKPMTDIGLDPSDIFPPSVVTHLPLAANGPVVKRVSQPLLTKQTTDSLVYGLPHDFSGFVRVTLRGCRRGERIRIGNLLYVCSGTDDEQAFASFVPYTGDSVVISGDSHFRSSQVQNVEAIESSLVES